MVIVTTCGVLPRKAIKVNADEIHISSNGILVLLWGGRIVQSYASGCWVTAGLE